MQRTTTLGELASWNPPADETDYVQRFISVIDEFYPDDWRSWEVNNVSYEDLFGDSISSDDECRLRFAVPTLRLAYVFSEGSPSLSERKYKRIKRQLITWPLGRAIIYRPFATMKKIHPADGSNRFTEVLTVLKSQLISRGEAAKILQSTNRKSRSSYTTPSTCQKRAWSSEPGPYKKARYADGDTDFIKQQNAMLEKLCQLVHEKISSHCRNANTEESESCESSDEGSVPSDNQDIQEDPTRELDSPTIELDETVESESKPKVADDALVKQGIACQRLGTDSWQNISYTEGKTKLEATPVFSNLKVNSNLAKITPQRQLVTVLEKMDLCLGAITHGLLQQRKEFQEIYQKATLEVKSVISKFFLSSESPFRRTSDALFQYTCGKRAQIIRQRRSIYRPSNKNLYNLLHLIPPSSTHLFAEPKLSELIKEHGGIEKCFPDTFIFLPNEERNHGSQEQDSEKQCSPEKFKDPNFETSERSAMNLRRRSMNRKNSAKQ